MEEEDKEKEEEEEEEEVGIKRRSLVTSASSELFTVW